MIKTVGKPTGRKPNIPFGHPNRLRAENRQITLLILGHVIVFVLAMYNDEIAETIFANGWIGADNVEFAEILIGIFLFACWSVLTVLLVRKFSNARKT